MAGTKISALTAAAGALGADEVPVNEAGITKKVTITQIFTLIQATSFNWSQNLISTARFFARGTGIINDVANLALAGTTAIDFQSHLTTTLSGTPGTSALGANVTSVTFTGNDIRGKIVIVMSGALAANTRIATCTYAVTYGTTPGMVMLATETSGVGLSNKDFYVGAESATAFDLFCNQALATGTETLKYLVIG